MCTSHRENVPHLFLVVVGGFWLVWCLLINALFCDGGLLCWNAHFGKINGGIWKVVPLCSMLYLWREMNAHCFEGRELSLVKLKFLLLKTLYEWTSTFYTSLTADYLEFPDILGFCWSSIVFFISTIYFICFCLYFLSTLVAPPLCVFQWSFTCQKDNIGIR